MQDPEHLRPAGKSAPMTVLTVVKPLSSLILRLVLWGVQKTALGLGRVKRLRFIHYAQWTLIKPSHFARSMPEQETDFLRRNYFMFSTNYNGPWDQYIDSFSLVPEVRNGIGLLWWTSQKFPSAFPVRPFKRYIRYYEYPVDAYYNAYPDATIRDIEAALEVQRLANELSISFRRVYAPLDPVIRADEAMLPSLNSIGPLALPGHTHGLYPAAHTLPKIPAELVRALREFTNESAQYLSSSRRQRTPTQKGTSGPQGMQL